MHPRTPFNLGDLHGATTRLIEKSSGLTVEELESDFDLQLIVERILERIGETLRRISDTIQKLRSVFPTFAGQSTYAT